jgi:hypothetical protein
MGGFVYLKRLTSAVVAIGFGVTAIAQTEAASRATESSGPGSTSTKKRVISPEIAAQLQAATPKYTPPPPERERKSEQELVDLREIDRPRNQIIRLPDYIVREPRPPVLNERDVHTQKGLTDIAVRRYISETDRAMNRFTLPLFGTSAEKRALAMYEEDERLRNMADLADNAAMVSTSDRAAGTYIKREAQKTYLRNNDFVWGGGNTVWGGGNSK